MGIVVGIRLIGEWFESPEIGLAQGIYGGWEVPYLRSKSPIAEGWNIMKL